MIQEQYVSFETAKLLKEKGFNEDTSNFYNPEGKICKYGDTLWIEMAKCPTQQMAMQWLRKKHNIFIEPCFYKGGCGWKTLDKNMEVIAEEIGKHNSYEDAIETAIKYCLEDLI